VKTLGLTHGSSVIALGISAQTLADISKPPRSEEPLFPPYSLLYRLLFEYPELSPVKPPISMMDFTSFVEEKTGVRLGDTASIMLGQQKTWYYKAINGEALSPSASNLARLYMHIIENGKNLKSVRKKNKRVEGLDFVLNIVEREATSRGLDPATLWKKGTWPRNIPANNKNAALSSKKRRVWPTPVNTSDAITSISIQETKKFWPSGFNELSYIDMSYFYGVTQHRMIELAKKYENPLELPPNAALITRCLEVIEQEEMPFSVPSMLPSDIFKMFENQGIKDKYTAAVLLGIGGNNHKYMLRNNESNSYTLRLGYYIAEGCKRDAKFMSKYLKLVNKDAMARGMKDKEIFNTEAWPVQARTKKKE
ncbi:hypothetical protein N9Y80_04730, partial [Porticoccaceae bacterium]|nr:hypothetical protein [Porticoccaceae bacterium]